ELDRNLMLKPGKTALSTAAESAVSATAKRRLNTAHGASRGWLKNDAAPEGRKNSSHIRKSGATIRAFLGLHTCHFLQGSRDVRAAKRTLDGTLRASLKRAGPQPIDKACRGNQPPPRTARTEAQKPRDRHRELVDPCHRAIFGRHGFWG